MRVDEIQVLVADVVLPPPDITVSQGADENRRLSSESGVQLIPIVVAPIARAASTAPKT